MREAKRKLKPIKKKREPELKRFLKKVYLRASTPEEKALSFSKKHVEPKEQKDSGLTDEEYRAVHVWDYEQGNQTRKNTASIDKEIKKISKNYKHPETLINRHNDTKKNVGYTDILPFLFLRDATFYFRGHLLVIDKKKLHSKLKENGIDYEIKPDYDDGLFGAFKIISKKNTDKTIPIKEIGKVISLTQKEIDEAENKPITNNFVHHLLKNVYKKNMGLTATGNHPMALWENNIPNVTKKIVAGKGHEKAKLNTLQKKEVIEYRKHLILKKKLLAHLKKTYD
jgi:glutaredoxin 2